MYETEKSNKCNDGFHVIRLTSILREISHKHLSLSLFVTHFHSQSATIYTETSKGIAHHFFSAPSSGILLVLTLY